jgi:hypothetical protein
MIYQYSCGYIARTQQFHCCPSFYSVAPSAFSNTGRPLCWEVVLDHVAAKSMTVSGVTKRERVQPTRSNDFPAITAKKVAVPC